jgi:hypothetical protein
MKAKIIHHAPVILPARLIHVELHPVDALDFQRDVWLKDIGHGAW